MSGLIHVFDLFDKRPVIPQQGICALFGSDRFLQQRALDEVLQQALADDYEDVPVSRFDSESAWADVVDELNTVSLFGSGGPRLAVVDDADSFVNAYRERLEDLVATPPAGLLILRVSKWPSNTRLFKAIEKKQGLQVDCGPPRRGKKKDVDLERVSQWLNKHARTQYKLKLAKDALPLLFELAQESFGIVEQGLVKLTLLLGENADVSAQQVQSIVGGWKTESTWNLIDQVVEGNTAAAIEQLDRLLQSGEAPQALFGQIAWSLRRFALATHIYMDAEQAGSRMPMEVVLGKANFNDWPRGRLEENARQMKHIGRARGQQIYRWLCDVDRALKGYASRGDAARRELEQLFTRFHRQLAHSPAAH
jgi:DNA polymerase-3 subunit delta